MTDLETYFRDIEDRFIRLRQRPLLLSPKDVQEIETWHREGIPLEIVIEGMNAYFDRIKDNPRRLRRFASVLYCKNEILDRFERHLDRILGERDPAREAELVRESDPARMLERLENALSAAADAAADAQAEAIVSSRNSVRRLRKKREMPPPEKIERSLERIEKRLVKSLTTTFDPAEVEAIERRVGDELAPYRGKIDPKVLDGLFSRGVQREVLGRLRLPRLTLFG